ncbi:MAG: hypothetical protein H6Q42_2693 [Deltaproteobacteria bacterium]|nr:hypothetical protein [Deltaproteobacteria bacterium]
MRCKGQKAREHGQRVEGNLPNHNLREKTKDKAVYIRLGT